nr:MAG TPA: hypothetical protein [Caudoviricetes sp.]
MFHNNSFSNKSLIFIIPSIILFNISEYIPLDTIRIYCLIVLD